METGTLKELNVNVGDLVQMECSGDQMVVHECPPRLGRVFEDHWSAGDGLWRDEKFRIISRANPTPDLTAITTPFGLLDKATQDALRAHGGPYEYFNGYEWLDDCDPCSPPNWAVRVKPQPKVETVTEDKWIDLHGNLTDEKTPYKCTPVRVTFTRTNGVIDLDSYKVEAR